MVIPKEDVLFKTRPKPKVNVQLRWISRFSKSSWIETTAIGLFYELGVNGAKKVNGNWDIINKNGHSTTDTGKHESQCQKNCYGYYHPSDDMYRACPQSSWAILVDIVVETRVKNCSKVFKEQLQMQTTETSFCICIKQKLFKFYYLLIFSPCFNLMIY